MPQRSLRCRGRGGRKGHPARWGPTFHAVAGAAL